jgi:hypothetical protein
MDNIVLLAFHTLKLEYQHTNTIYNSVVYIKNGTSNINKLISFMAGCVCSSNQFIINAESHFTIKGMTKINQIKNVLSWAVYITSQSHEYVFTSSHVDKQTEYLVWFGHDNLTHWNLKHKCTLLLRYVVHMSTARYSFKQSTFCEVTKARYLDYQNSLTELQ